MQLWRRSKYLGPTPFYRTCWLVLIAYALLSIAAIYLLSYQPWRGDSSPKLLREAFISAAYDFPLSLLAVATYLAYADTNNGAALLIVAVGSTLSKFVRYWAMGLGMRRELNHTSLFIYMQPTATIMMAIGFLHLL